MHKVKAHTVIRPAIPAIVVIFLIRQFYIPILRSGWAGKTCQLEKGQIHRVLADRLFVDGTRPGNPQDFLVGDGLAPDIPSWQKFLGYACNLGLDLHP